MIRKNIGRIRWDFLLLTITVLMPLWYCSLFESPSTRIIGQDIDKILLELMNNGNVASNVDEKYNPEITLLALLNLVLKQENNDIMSDNGIGVEPLPHTVAGVIRGIRSTYQVKDCLSAFFYPNIAEVFPNMYQSSYREYYLDSTLQAQINYETFMETITTNDNIRSSLICHDIYTVVEENIVTFQFELDQLLYYNHYHFDRASIDFSLSPLLNNPFDYIEMGIAREHFPDKVVDGPGFIQNQYGLSIFYGLKDAQGEYIQFTDEDCCTILIRAVWTNAGADLGSDLKINVSEDDISDGILTLFSDFLKYMQLHFSAY